MTLDIERIKSTALGRAWLSCLTPLGVEVFLYGRKQAGKRGGR